MQHANPVLIEGQFLLFKRMVAERRCRLARTGATATVASTPYRSPASQPSPDPKWPLVTEVLAQGLVCLPGVRHEPSACNSSRTEDGPHEPPRNPRIPSALRVAAIARRVAPSLRKARALVAACARSGAASAARTARPSAAASAALGLPRRTPLAFAAASAAIVRALIWSRSCSAKAASRCTRSFVACGFKRAVSRRLT